MKDKQILVDGINDEDIYKALEDVLEQEEINWLNNIC